MEFHVGDRVIFVGPYGSSVTKYLMESGTVGTVTEIIGHVIMVAWDGLNAKDHIEGFSSTNKWSVLDRQIEPAGCDSLADINLSDLFGGE